MTPSLLPLSGTILSHTRSLKSADFGIDQSAFEIYERIDAKQELGVAARKKNVNFVGTMMNERKDSCHSSLGLIREGMRGVITAIMAIRKSTIARGIQPTQGTMYVNQPPFISLFNHCRISISTSRTYLEWARGNPSDGRMGRAK